MKEIAHKTNGKNICDGDAARDVSGRWVRSLHEHTVKRNANADARDRNANTNYTLGYFSFYAETIFHL